MAKPRDPLRAAAEKLYLESGGRLTPKEIAAKINKNIRVVQRWKQADSWEDKLPPKKSPKGGAPRGNKNSKGKQNALKHGIYSSVDLSNLTALEAEVVKHVSYPLQKDIEDLYKRLLVKEKRLQDMLDKLDAEIESGKALLYTDMISTYIEPKTLEELTADAMEAEAEKAQEIYIESSDLYVSKAKADPTALGPKEKIKIKIINQNSAYKRRSQIEGELNRVQRALIKLLDTMKSHELESKRLELENKRFSLAIAQATGQIDILEPDIAEITEIEDI